MALNKSGDFTINTIIGHNTTFVGDITVGGFARIDGSIRGNIKANGRVVIGECARMKGHLRGTNITVGGVVCGNIIADGHLVILSTAIILGDVITRRIQVDNECIVNGMVKVCSDEESWRKTISEYMDAQGIKSALPVF